MITLAIRLLAAWSLPLQPLQPDFAEYQALADEMRTHGEFAFGDHWREHPELAGSTQRFAYEDHGARFRTPGIPLLLMLCDVAGVGARGLQVLMALCDATSAALLWQLARRLAGERAAWLAAAGFACDPLLLYLGAKLAREPLLGLLTMLTLRAVVALADATAWTGRWRRHAVALGAVAGAGALVKESLLPLTGVLVVWLAWRRRAHLRQVGQLLGIVAIVATLGVAPWLARNAAVTGRVSGLSTMGQVALYLAILPKDRPFAATIHALGLPTPDEAGRPAASIAAASRIAQVYATTHPVAAATESLRNAGWFWSPVSRYNAPSALAWLAAAAGAVLLTGAATGLLRHRKRPEVQAIFWLLLANTGMHALALSVPRYRAPLHGVLWLLAAWATVAAHAEPSPPPEDPA